HLRRRRWADDADDRLPHPVEIHRLADVAAGADQLRLPLESVGGDDQDRQGACPGELSQGLEEGPAAHHRHPEIEQHRQRDLLRERVQGLPPVARGPGGVPHPLQQVADQGAMALVVVDYQDEGHGAPLLGAGRWSCPPPLGNPPRRGGRMLGTTGSSTPEEVALASVRSLPWWVLVASGLAFAGGAPPGGSDAGSTVPAHQAHPGAPKPPARKGQMVDRPLPDGKASAAYVSRPKNTPRGSVLLVHEWWGLNGWMKAEADKMASQGYLALAVDLFHGKVATTDAEAEELMKALDDTHATQVETAGIDWLAKAAPGTKGATIGWAWGVGQGPKAFSANSD